MFFEMLVYILSDVYLEFHGFTWITKWPWYILFFKLNSMKSQSHAYRPKIYSGLLPFMICRSRPFRFSSQSDLLWSVCSIVLKTLSKVISAWNQEYNYQKTINIFHRVKKNIDEVIWRNVSNTRTYSLKIGIERISYHTKGNL